MEGMQILKNRIVHLESEITYLKSLLDNAGISYVDFKDTENLEETKQGSRIIPKRDITSEDAKKFYEYFVGRVDVYSKRTIVKSTGVANYYVQCDKVWKYDCPKKNNPKFPCSKCGNPKYSKLKVSQIIAHLKGEDINGEDVIGIYPLLPDDTCRLLVFDFDNHTKGAEKQDFANENDVWKEEVNAIRKICENNGIDCLVERSRSGRGAHVWIFFEERIEAKLARTFGNALLRKGMESVNLKSFTYFDRMYPLQDHMPKGGFGNLIALPLQGLSLKKGNSAFVDSNWNTYPDQWKILYSKSKLTRLQIEEKIEEWKINKKIQSLPLSEIAKESNIDPWDKTNSFQKNDVDGRVFITLSDAIYIKTSNLKPQIQNQIREMAAFRNPIYYKNQAMGLSNFEQSCFIYLGEDIDGYLKIPRGLLNNLCDKLTAANITYDIVDKRQNGRTLQVSFSGELKNSQKPAVEAMLKYDTGILQAATAFGKTVVCCNLIARKKVNTLILLQSTALIEQWEKALAEFLIIDEEPPEYKTASGRIRVRKSVIGKIHGSHDSSTGIIDIAMVGSLCKKGEFHSRLKEYGMVILDECHHAASDTIVDVLEHTNANYVYGLTATPARSDGLEKINY